MIELSVKIKADGQTVRHAGIAGTDADQAALVELLDEVMANPQQALAVLRAAAKGQVAYPDEMTPELDEVLGWPLFKCGPYAHVFQKAGYNIPRKAEREQAFIHHWLIKLVLRHGANWATVAEAELKTLLASSPDAEEGAKA